MQKIRGRLLAFSHPLIKVKCEMLLDDTFLLNFFSFCRSCHYRVHCKKCHR